MRSTQRTIIGAVVPRIFTGGLRVTHAEYAQLIDQIDVVNVGNGRHTYHGRMMEIDHFADLARLLGQRRATEAYMDHLNQQHLLAQLHEAVTLVDNFEKVTGTG